MVRKSLCIVDSPLKLIARLQIKSKKKRAVS